MCYRYETMSHDCDQIAESRSNHFDGTKYFHQAFLVKSCDGDARKVLLAPPRCAHLML